MSAKDDPLAVARLYLKLTANEDERRALRALLEAMTQPDMPSALREPILF
jgi:hypothetical protein